MPGVLRTRIPGVNGNVRYRASLPLTALTAIAAVTLATGCSSSSPAPAWCAPLVATFHAHQSRQAYLDGLVAAEGHGAPAGRLIEDETAYTQDEADAASTGTGSFAALAAAPKALAKVSADLKALNAECGQPADAYKSDDA